MKKKSLNQSETIRWLIFSWLPEFITLLYVIIRSIVDSYFLDHFIITALFFSVLIVIYTYLKAGLMVCSYFILVKINNNEKDDNKELPVLPSRYTSLSKRESCSIPLLPLILSSI